MAKQKLVVIGNGMAGARAVEEVLSRGGGDMFDIVMFGDEPYGNYNRILLSNLLNGSQTPGRNPDQPAGLVRRERHHAAFRRTGGQCRPRVESSDVAQWRPCILRQAPDRDRQPRLHSAVQGAMDDKGKLKTGLFGYRTVDDCTAIVDYAKKSKVAVTIGGGLLGLEAARAMMVLGCESHVVHLAGILLDMQLDTTAGAILKRPWRAWASTSISANRRPRCSATAW